MILTLTIPLATAGSIFSSIIMMTTPRSSRPRRPARPDIWIYSPDDTYRKSRWFNTHNSNFVYSDVLSSFDTYPSCVLAVEFSYTSENNRFGRHIKSNRECFGGEKNLQKTLLEENLNSFFQNREQTAMMDSNTAAKEWKNVFNLRELTIVFIERADRIFENLRHHVPFAFYKYRR